MNPIGPLACYDIFELATMIKELTGSKAEIVFQPARYGEEPYRFTSLDRLVSDFLKDLARWRGER